MVQHSVPNLFYCFGSVSVTELCTEIQSYTLYIGRVFTSYYSEVPVTMKFARFVKTFEIS